MNPRHFLLAILLFVSLSTRALSQTSTDPNEGSRLSRDPSTGAYTFSWWGVGGRTYFIQQSDDLLTWTYLPVIESGEDQILQWGFTSTEARFFVRLVYADIYTSDPFNDDFDGDGVSNYNELLQGTDPLSSGFDSNGLPLDWEKFYSVPVGTDPNAYAPRADGLSYLQAFQQGLSPNDIFNGGSVTVAVVSGDNQSASNGQFLGNPLIVHLSDATSGIPLTNCPVTFSSTTAQIYFDPTYDYHDSSMVLYTDDSGNATAYVMLPATGVSHQITASATSSANTSSVVFHATTSQLIANPQSFNVTVDSGEKINTYLALTNPTSSDCSYSIDPASLSIMNGGQSVTWLTFPYSSGSGTVSAGQGSTIYVQFSGVNVPPGTYTASLSIKDQNGNIVGPSIPVSMTATGNPLLDTDGSGLPDNWQMRYFGHLGVDPNADPDLDGFSNYEEYLYGFDPTDFYNGQPDNLTFIQGTDQRAAPPASGTPTALAVPLSVQVGSGYDQNAPVSFMVTSGHALIAASNDPNATQPTSSLQLTSASTYVDANGEQHNVAQVYVYLPNIVGDVSTIQAYVTSGGRTVAINTTAVASDPNLAPPSNLIGMQTDATTVALSWTVGDNTQPTTIQESTDGVNWTTIGVVGPGVNSISVTGLPLDVATYFRVFTGGDYNSGGSGSNGTLAFNANNNPAAPSAPGGGSTATPAASVTPVSKPTLYGDQDHASKGRLGIPGYQAPVVPPTLYLTEVKTNVVYDPVHGYYTGNRVDTTKTDPVTGVQTTTTVITPIWSTDFTSAPGQTPTVGNFVVNSDTNKTQRIDWNGDPRANYDGIYNIETDVLQDQTDPTAIQSAYNAYSPNFDYKFNENTFTASLSAPDARELGYDIRSLLYNFKTVPDPYGLVCWVEEFLPDPFTQVSNNYRKWTTAGNAQSNNYLLNPKAQNNGQSGAYYVIQLPVDTIQIEAFIPQEYVKAPWPYDFPANGNYKKTPLDASFTTGKALFKQDKPGDKLAYKLFETMSVTEFASDDNLLLNPNENDADSIVHTEAVTNNIQQGTTLKFDDSQIVAGHLPQASHPIASATGTPTTQVSTTHPGVNHVTASIYSYGNDPFVFPSVFAPITWVLNVSIDRSTSPPTYTITGSHKQFPAYVIYINGQQVYTYDPIPYKRKPFPDLTHSQDVNVSGTLNQ